MRNTNSEIFQKFVDRKFIRPYVGKKLYELWVDQQSLQIPEPHFDKFPTPQTFSCWKMSSMTEVCSCYKFVLEALLWIQEVEVTSSVDG